MKSFRTQQVQLLVATDVAARGIDVEDITHVINYQLPDEMEIYTHRSGRTGRAGKSGTSMVIISKSELRKIKAIEKIIKQPFEEKPIPSGIEICEIQLFHLANKINDIEIDHEIERYLPVIFDVFKKISKEDLIKKMVSVEFNRFLNYYKNTAELTTESKSYSRDSKERSNDENSNSVRYFINVGARDNFDWKKLKDFLTIMLELTRDDVFKVDVKDNFSFFNTESKYKTKVFEAFSNFRFEGRRVNVEISKNEKPDNRSHDFFGPKNRKEKSSSYSEKKPRFEKSSKKDINFNSSNNRKKKKSKW